MKRTLLVASLMAISLMAGCLTDDGTDDDTGDDTAPAWSPGKHSHPAYGYPVNEDLPMWNETVSGLPSHWKQIPPGLIPETITQMQHQGSVSGVDSGAGIALFGPYAFVGNYSAAEYHIINISDPTAPVIEGTVEVLGGDSDVIAYPDGRLVVVTASRSSKMFVVDVTDPSDPILLSEITSTQGNHNLQVVPGTPILYNAASSGANNYPDPLALVPNPAADPAGKNDIWDLSDPRNPVHVQDFDNGYGCHAIDFYINADEGKYRGYCAGIEVTQIWDVTDPLNPEVISEFPFPTGGVDQEGNQGVAPVTFSHLAMPNHDGTVLIVGDETGGGAAPGCDAFLQAGGMSATGPLGNLFFYDISGDKEKDPVLHGSYSPSAADERGGCTAHFGGIIEDRPLIAIAYYTVGVVLVDFADLDNPREVDIWAPGEATDACVLCGVWDAQYYNGYIFTGDITRGMDVLTLA